MQPKGVGRKQAIASDVPTGGKAKTIGMIENGDSDGLSVHGTMIIDPLGGLAPSGLIGLIPTVDDLPAALGVTRSVSATRTPNAPSFVSPNATGPSAALMATSKSIQRALPSASKRSVRSSSQILLPSGPSQLFWVAMTAGFPLAALTNLTC